MLQVPEEYFQRKKPETTGSPIKVKIGHAARAKASSRNRRRYDVSDSGGCTTALYAPVGFVCAGALAICQETQVHGLLRITDTLLYVLMRRG